ncbi:MFS transporter [Micromonospora endolithica]|uniref:MFS transporter n=1 Tax=Micromonospora endolithica TaxID=230091 RepID=A0A3A9Z3Y3_9ACTN|nr:MFS transporter [Micromonospora endolithica]RKN42017.1 MFS transporter [Micromonospora endolithica]TWJ26247.1 putative MFS family arabinose efflux permease [Micromonospora endolithica]
MSTYRELFRTPEFTPLFAGTSVAVAARTLSGLALGTMVYAATGSPLLAALSMFGPSFAQLLGVFTVLSAADRLPPRAATVGIACLFAAGTATLAVPGLPGWGTALVILGIGLVSSLAGGVRWALLGEILSTERYLLGRSVFNMAVGVMQIAGFALGGVLVAVLTPRQALLVAAGLHLVAAAVALLGLTTRPPRAPGRPSIRRTWQVNGRLWASPGRRTTYLALWVPNGLVVGCEALYVPYAPASASALFVVTAFGMLAGDTFVGRFLPQRYRHRLITPLQVLLAAPFLLFALPLPPGLALTAAGLGAVGFGAGLLLQDRLLAQTDDEVRGQALGLHSAGMLSMHAVGATVAGAVAEFLPVGTAMAVMAAASLCVSATLAAALRRPVPARVRVG